MTTKTERLQHPAKRVRPWRLEAHAMAALATPLVFTELSYMAIITTDIVMMGWLGPEALAAGTLAGHYYAFFEFFTLGLLGAVAPILAHDLGARRFRMIRRTVRQGFWIAVMVALPSIAVIWHGGTVLGYLGQDPDLSFAGQSYLRFMVVGFLPGLWLLVLAEFLAAHMRPRATLIVSLFGIAFNVLADYVLMFGHFGFPRLGLVGAGIASAIVTTLMFLLLMGFVLLDKRLRRYRLLGRFWRIDWPHLYEIVRIGLPIAVSQLAAIGMFLASALLIGLLGTASLAAHAIALQCIEVAYMVPLGISQAATVRVGRAVGAGNHGAIALSGWTALALAAACAFLPATAFWLFGDKFVGLFLDVSLVENQATAQLAVSFLAIAALFGVTDAIQVTSLGVLRGLKDTRGPMIISLFGYWGLGLPSAAYFGVYLGYGGQAIWASLAVAISLNAALLIWRFQVRSGRAKL